MWPVDGQRFGFRVHKEVPGEMTNLLTNLFGGGQSPGSDTRRRESGNDLRTAILVQRATTGRTSAGKGQI